MRRRIYGCQYRAEWTRMDVRHANFWAGLHRTWVGGGGERCRTVAHALRPLLRGPEVGACAVLRIQLCNKVWKRWSPITLSGWGKRQEEVLQTFCMHPAARRGDSIADVAHQGGVACRGRKGVRRVFFFPSCLTGFWRELTKGLKTATSFGLGGCDPPVPPPNETPLLER